MTVVDSSALAAIAFEEPGFNDYIQAVAKAPECYISATTLLEASIVIYARRGDDGLAFFNDFLTKHNIQILDFTAEQARLAIEAYKQYGKGMGHPAQLNLLDCCSWAVARQTGRSLLYKGADFASAGIPSAL